MQQQKIIITETKKEMEQNNQGVNLLIYNTSLDPLTDILIQF